MIFYYYLFYVFFLYFVIGCIFLRFPFCLCDWPYGGCANTLIMENSIIRSVVLKHVSYPRIP